MLRRRRPDDDDVTIADAAGVWGVQGREVLGAGDDEVVAARKVRAPVGVDGGVGNSSTLTLCWNNIYSYSDKRYSMSYFTSQCFCC